MKGAITHTSATEPEWHPWLKLFTTMAMVAGLITILPICLMASSISDLLGAVLFMMLNVAPGVALIWASLHTLKATDHFRRWNSGVSQRDKLIGYVVIFFGIAMTIALFFAIPFMRFIWGESRPR